MYLCIALVIPYLVFILLFTHGLFVRNPAMKDWIYRIQTSTKINLAEMASLSTLDAIRTFQAYLFVFAFVIFLGGLFVAHVVSDAVRSIFMICALTVGYCGLSIGAWSNRRKEITKDFVADAIGKIRSGLIFVPLVVLLMIAVGIVFHMRFSIPLDTIFYYASLAFGAGIMIWTISVCIATSISLAIIFLPALLALAYLWLVIKLSRLVLSMGGRGLANVIEVYGVVGSIYLLIASFPELQSALGMPHICTDMK